MAKVSSKDWTWSFSEASVQLLAKYTVLSKILKKQEYFEDVDKAVRSSVASLISTVLRYIHVNVVPHSICQCQSAPPIHNWSQAIYPLTLEFIYSLKIPSLDDLCPLCILAH